MPHLTPLVGSLGSQEASVNVPSILVSSGNSDMSEDLDPSFCVKVPNTSNTPGNFSIKFPWFQYNWDDKEHNMPVANQRKKTTA